MELIIDILLLQSTWRWTGVLLWALWICDIIFWLIPRSSENSFRSYVFIHMYSMQKFIHWPYRPAETHEGMLTHHFFTYFIGSMSLEVASSLENVEQEKTSPWKNPHNFKSHGIEYIHACQLLQLLWVQETHWISIKWTSTKYIFPFLHQNLQMNSCYMLLCCDRMIVKKLGSYMERQTQRRVISLHLQPRTPILYPVWWLRLCRHVLQRRLLNRRR